MIALNIIAALVVLYRIVTRRFTAFEYVLLALILGNWLVIAAQVWVIGGWQPPEDRYWLEASTLAFGWIAWGIWELSKILTKKFVFAKYLLPVIIGLFALANLILVSKAHIPGSRRNAYVIACNWAADKIKADWHGPTHDAKSVFLVSDYHQSNRPIVMAHTARVPYLINGRDSIPHIYGSVDWPDYIVDEPHKIARIELKGPKYKLIDSLKVGKRTFELHKRIK